MLTQKTTNLLLVITYKPQVTQASEEVFTIKMQKHENMWQKILPVSKLLEISMNKNCKSQINRVYYWKSDKEKGYKLHVKWKSYDNLFDS